MRRAFYIFLLFAIFGTIGCKVTGDYFIGNRFSGIHVVLKKDSTYIYKSWNDLGGPDTIKGKWAIIKGMIVLNSFLRPKFTPDSVYERTEPNKTEKLIVVRLMDGAISNSTLSIDKGRELDTLRRIDDTNYFKYVEETFEITGAYTHLDSIRTIKILKTDWMEYTLIPDCVLKDSTFNISNPSSNVIIIYAQPYNHYMGMNYFVNTQWKFHFNRIYPWKKTKDKFDKRVFLSKKRTHLYESGVLP